MEDEVQERLEKLEDVVSGLKEIPDGVFESEGETHEVNVSSEVDNVESNSSTDETCDVVKSDGEVCGREVPCPYHGDE